MTPSAPEHSTTNLWINYRATAETVTKSGTNVTGWAKTAGSGSTTMANMSAVYPVWNATDSKLNNRPSIKFGANDQVLSANVVATINTSAGSFTTVLWMNATTDTGVIVGFMRPGTSVRYQFECTASGKMGIDVFDGSSFQTNSEATSFSANTAYVVTVLWTATAWYVRRNGSQILTVTNSHALDNVETGGGGIIITFGGNNASVASPVITEETEFTMAEYVHYLAVDNTNIATVENALASWYGITF